MLLESYGYIVMQCWQRESYGECRLFRCTQLSAASLMWMCRTGLDFGQRFSYIVYCYVSEYLRNPNSEYLRATRVLERRCFWFAWLGWALLVSYKILRRDLEKINHGWVKFSVILWSGWRLHMLGCCMTIWLIGISSFLIIPSVGVPK
jgi:hypothetical protein